MKIIAIKSLKLFWQQHSQAEKALRGWYAEASKAQWSTPAEIKAIHRNAGFLGNNRVVFNIKGNDYRWVVAVRYTQQLMFIRFIGTHAEYDRINAETI